MRFRGSLIISTVVLLFALTIAGWLYYTSAQSAATPAAVSTAPQPGDTATKTPTETVRPSTSSTPVTVKIAEAEATAAANQYVSQAGFPLDLDNLQIRFQNGQVQATANVKVSGFKVPATAQAVVDIRAGKPVVTVQKVDVAGLGAPESVRQQIGDAIRKGLDQALPKNLPVVFDSVTIASGVMTLSGHQNSR